MKITIAALALLLFGPPNALAQGARLQLDDLDGLAARAEESVNITVDPAMLKLASAFFDGPGKEAAIKEMLAGLRGIYVRSFEFERENAYTADDVNAIRTQLTAPGWSRLVTVDSKRDGELLEIYSWQEGGESGGLAILVAQPTELTVVNIVGPIDLAKLRALQGQLGIPNLPIDGNAPSQ